MITKPQLKTDTVDQSSYYIQLFDFSGPDLDVDTGLFLTKPYQVLGVWDVEGEDELDTQDMSSVATFLSFYLDSGNDGGLLWIPAKAANAFPEFATKFLMNAYSAEELNLSNGPISEAFVLYKTNDGLVGGLLDPECGTGVFAEAITQFLAEQGVENQDDFETFHPEKAFWFEDCHLSSNLKLGRNDETVDVFLKALHERGLVGELEIDGE
jgi:hypothetical protein